MSHQKLPEGAACACCFDDLADSGESANYVEYRTSPADAWLPCKYCQTCTEHIQGTQYGTYHENVEKATCAAALRRLLSAGPPVYLTDKEALPVPDGTSATELWFASDNAVHTAKLVGALEGAARQANWDEIRAKNTARLDELPDTTELAAAAAESQ